MPSFATSLHHLLGAVLVLLLCLHGVIGQDCATTYTDGTTFNGNDLFPPAKAANATACLSTCEANVACYAVVYSIDGKCSLKSIHYLDQATTKTQNTFMAADLSCLRGAATMGTIDLKQGTALVTVEYALGTPAKYVTVTALWTTAKLTGPPSQKAAYYSDAAGKPIGTPEPLPTTARTDILGPNDSPTNTTVITALGLDTASAAKTSVAAFLETTTNGTQMFYATVSPPLPSPPPPPAPSSPPPLNGSDPPAVPISPPVLPPPPPGSRSAGAAVSMAACLACLFASLLA